MGVEINPLSSWRWDEVLAGAEDDDATVRLMGSGWGLFGYSVMFALPLSLAAGWGHGSDAAADRIWSVHRDAVGRVVADLDARVDRFAPGLELPRLDYWSGGESSEGTAFPHTHVVLPLRGERDGAAAEVVDRGLVDEWADGAWSAYRAVVVELVAARLGAKMRHSEASGDVELANVADWDGFAGVERRRCPAACERRLVGHGPLEPIVPASWVSWR
jgi:hypothetical protein